VATTKKKAKAKPAAPSKSGKLALLGRPNAGKSTLLNAILGEPLAIVSHHPQTTRDSILGIIHREEVEFVLLDTPGLHRSRTALGARMNAYAKDAADQADVIVYVVELPQAAVRLSDPKENTEENPAPIEMHAEDRQLLKSLPANVPVILVISKIDKIKEKSKLLRVLQGFGAAHEFAAIVPISAKKNDGVGRVLDAVQEHFEERGHEHDGESLTDRPARYFVSEYLREQILLHTDKEVPHGIAVVVERWQKDKKCTHIGVVVHVDKDSHRPIILGKAGSRIKSIATRARARIEKLLDEHVNLEITVRVTPGWYENPALLDELGYGKQAE
jgi:GTP-binding protein Era